MRLHVPFHTRLSFHGPAEHERRPVVGRQARFWHWTLARDSPEGSVELAPHHGELGATQGLELTELALPEIPVELD